MAAPYITTLWGAPMRGLRLLEGEKVPASKAVQLVHDGVREGEIGGRFVRHDGYQELTKEVLAQVEIDIDGGTAAHVPVRYGDPLPTGLSFSNGDGEEPSVLTFMHPGPPAAERFEIHLHDLKVYADKMAALNAPPKAKGGRPAEHDWTSIAFAAASYCVREGVPSRASELVRYLQDRFPDGPEESTLRRRIDPWLSELRRELNGPA